MAKPAAIVLSVEDTARLLHVQPQTVRRRLRSGELERAATIAGADHVRLIPEDTWLRAEDAGALLTITPTTVRANIHNGRLAGRRETHGRWRVQLSSILEDRRCDSETLALFTGDAAPSPPPDPFPRRRAGLHRSVFVRLSPEEEELLERVRDRYGTIRGAVVAGLVAADSGDVDTDVAELRTEHALYREQSERLRAAHSGLRERTEGRLVDELRCHVCEQWVPVEECEAVELPDGRLEVFHKIHGHRSGSRFRSNTGLARRRALTLDDLT